MKKFFLPFILFGCLLGSCEKDQNRKMLGAYVRYSIKGAETVITDGAGVYNNIFDCTVRRDSTLIINAAKIYEGVGFVIRNTKITDGTYVLDSMNKAYYTNPVDQKRYYTTNKFKGTLTIKKSNFQAKELLNTLEGTFSFQAVDTATGKNFKIEKGSFVMERKQIY